MIGRGGPQLSSLFANTRSAAWLETLAQPEPTQPPFAGADLRLQLEYPREMRVNTPETIALTLSRTTSGVTATVAGAAGTSVIVLATPPPVGTPGVPIELARGANFSAFAVARIPASSGVQVALTTPLNEEQPLDRERLTWSWSVVSPGEGTRKIRLNLELRFKPNTSGAGPTREEPIWSPEMTINVQQPGVIVIGPLEVPTNTLALNLIGTGLSSQVPLLIGWVRNRITGKVAPPPKRGRRKRT